LAGSSSARWVATWSSSPTMPPAGPISACTCLPKTRSNPDPQAARREPRRVVFGRGVLAKPSHCQQSTRQGHSQGRRDRLRFKSPHRPRGPMLRSLPARIPVADHAASSRRLSRRGLLRRRRTRGQSLVEFALVLPVMLLIIMVGVDFGRAFLGWVNLQNSSRLGANYAAIHPNANWGNAGDSDTIRYTALINLYASQAQVAWTNAGFSTALIITRPPNGDYKVGSQSITAGQSPPTGCNGTTITVTH